MIHLFINLFIFLLLFIGANKPEDIEPILYVSVVDIMYCCLPERIKKPFRCGIKRYDPDEVRTGRGFQQKMVQCGNCHFRASLKAHVRDKRSMLIPVTHSTQCVAECAKCGFSEQANTTLVQPRSFYGPIARSNMAVRIIYITHEPGSPNNRAGFLLQRLFDTLANQRAHT